MQNYLEKSKKQDNHEKTSKNLITHSFDTLAI